MVMFCLSVCAAVCSMGKTRGRECEEVSRKFVEITVLFDVVYVLYLLVCNEVSIFW